MFHLTPDVVYGMLSSHFWQILCLIFVITGFAYRLKGYKSISTMLILASYSTIYFWPLIWEKIKHFLR